jgi:hypothetical protein
LQLPLLKLLPYSNRKFGGWVAENFVAITRISKWFYQPLPTITAEETWIQPTTLVNDWLSNYLWNWLKKRALPATGLKAELYEKVNETINSCDGIPEIVAPSGGSVDQLLFTINCLYDLIALVMQPSIVETDLLTAEVYVRVFLTKYSKLDEHLYSKKELCSWHSKYNFHSLTRCVEQMRKTGSLRNIYEGGFCGEGYIPFVKPMITSGLCAKWPLLLMRNLQ